MRISKQLFFLSSFLICSIISFAQILPSPNYPKGYFQWPLSLKPELIGNFGELRPNHYHMGLDCRTDQKQNQPVHAAAAGYIAKVKIEPLGFGRCIYINHPNGLTTLYAHLNDFFPELENYVKNQQYKQKSWKVFLDIPANLFPVTKGQLIAYSGSTGASQGPHTHFEIRNTKSEIVLNPLLFGFNVTDNIAPDIFKLAVYNRNISTYEQTPQLFSVKKINGVYISSPALIITNSNKISFGITASDRNNVSRNRDGIYQALLFEDEKPIIGFQLDSISYDETRYANANIDYRLRSSGGPFVQHLSRLAGYPDGIYKLINGDGVINILDDSVHKIKIEIKDANGNTSLVQFEIKHIDNAEKKIITAVPSTDLLKEFYPGELNIFENDHLSFYLPEQCLYDSFRFQYKEIFTNTGGPIYQLHNNTVPLHVAFSLKIKAIFPDSLKEKIVMKRWWNNKSSFAKSTPVKVYQHDWYEASFREFGNFQLLVDTIPPTIYSFGFKDGANMSKQNRIIFVINDNSEELKNFTAMLDGRWLRFSNDKGKTFIYEFDEMCPPGLHELKVSVEDLLGNRTEKIYHFTR